MQYIARFIFPIVLSGCVLPGLASAAIISVDDATFGVGTLTRDTAQGLDFLDVTFSTNRSYNDVSTEFGVGGDFEGYRYATEQEVVNLVNNWGFSPGAVAGGDVIGNSGGDQLSGLVNLLGETILSPGAQRRIFGITGTLITPTNVRGTWITDPFAPLTEDRVRSDVTYTLGVSDPAIGSYLLRNSAAVPEPSSFALLGLGAVGVAGYRRRKRKRPE